MLIRDEERKDWGEVRAVNASAFAAAAEADLVDALRDVAAPIVSLVAEDAERVVGHILFSPVSLSGHPELDVMGLAPMAVVPERQREGVGSKLVRAGLERCRQMGFGAVVVLGHPEYYPRFGFVPSSRYGIASGYDVPEDAFMILELEPDYLTGISGVIKYHAVFDSL